MHTETQPIAAAAAFALAAARYWSAVWPLAACEIRRCHQLAAAIPDPRLRAAAQENLRDERGNLEGAAAYAVLAGRGHRRPLLEALVGFQAIYDYVDTLVEHPDHAEPTRARRLHQALADAVSPATPPTRDYYGTVHAPDGGYLTALVSRCRSAVALLPGHRAAEPVAGERVARMIAYQVHNHTEQTDRTALAAWGAAIAPPGSDLRWWESAAAAASSLAVFALLAHAARKDLTGAAASEIAEAYVPAGALHVLLDSLADRTADERTGDHSLVSHYRDQAETTARLTELATTARERALQLPAGATHATIIAAMGCYYLAAVDDAPRAAPAIAAALGPTARPSLLILRVRRALAHRSAPAR
ncbi:DUF2600 family protein [Conexibacter arvalis]|uniref:Tetraprenyl-beta-curcumene synthase n=1 Tax=Conexibacter arvalis TaxID=912552 RepID=A0A840I910_9ACTN|nr:DUF2600 family protein [Conexibacter arvalis]MBB4660805.1 tetraprenyl-beta-curcumene synthase [Conexibacter arvalis]